MDAAARDYALTGSSEARGITVPLAAAAEAHPVELEYAPTGGAPRSGTTAAGAFE